MAESSKSTRFRFTDTFDLHLAREVYGQNPYELPSRWATIQVNMLQIIGKSVSIRTLRERIQNLIKKYLAKAKSLEGKSGIETEVTELDDLLQQISCLQQEFMNKKCKTTTATLAAEIKTSYLKGVEAREDAASSSFLEENICEVYSEDIDEDPIQEEVVECVEEQCKNEIPESPQIKVAKKRSLAQANILTPLRKRGTTGIRQNTVQYLEKKNERQFEIRCRELALEERKAALEEQKFKWDKEERQRRLETEEKRLEMEEKRMKIQFENQQQLIKMIKKD